MSHPGVTILSRASGFVPTADYWWDAGRGVTQASSLVTQWSSRDAHAIALTNTGGITRPDYNAANANLANLPTVGTGVLTSQLVQCTSGTFTVPAPFTIMLLAYWPNPVGAGNHYAFDGGSGGAQRALFMTSAVGQIYNGTSTAASTGSVFNAAKHVVTCRFMAGTNNARIYVDSVTTFTQGTFASMGSLGGLTLGNFLGGGGFAGGIQLAHHFIFAGDIAGTGTMSDHATYLATLGGITLV